MPAAVAIRVTRASSMALASTYRTTTPCSTEIFGWITAHRAS
jgi:hypothetical protein